MLSRVKQTNAEFYFHAQKKKVANVNTKLRKQGKKEFKANTAGVYEGKEEVVKKHDEEMNSTFKRTEMAGKIQMKPEGGGGEERS